MFSNIVSDPINKDVLDSDEDPRPIIPSSAPRRMLDSFSHANEESTVIEFETSFISFNGESTSSLSVIRGCLPFPQTNYCINVSITPEKKQKEFKHVIETAMCYDPEVKKILTFINFYREVTSKNGIDGLVLLSKDELRLLHCKS